MIQNVIARMSQSSFQARGFSVVIVAALLGLDATQQVSGIVRVALVPALVLWMLDGFYVSQDRRFRRLYDHVRCLSNAAVDFSMDASPYASWRQGWLAATFSRTVVLLHGGIVAAILLTVWCL